MRWGCVIALFVLLGCNKSEWRPEDRTYNAEVPVGFPPLSIPDDNALTDFRVLLGKKLFFDTRISGDGTVSCGSCHKPEFAFADNQAVSLGVEGRIGFRNAPSLANVGYQERLFMDGGVPTLELQVLAPFDNHAEMDLSITKAIEMMRNDEHINALAQFAYGREMDAFVFTRSIAAFERTLLSGNSPYDRFLRGDNSALSPDAIAGMELFFGQRLACGSCHTGFLLTDQSYSNIGLYEEYADMGLQRVTTLPSDNGKFKVPSLRNVALTAPYMHDGSRMTLQQVIEHYNAGGKNHPAKDDRIRPLLMSMEEKMQLLAFLEGLTDIGFTENQAFQPE